MSRYLISRFALGVQRPVPFSGLFRTTTTATKSYSTSSTSLVQTIDSMKSFKDKIQDEKLSVIDFYADWCGPCKAIAPILEKFALDYQTDTQFLKVNVDEQGEIAQEFGVTAMPTFMLFKKGDPIGKIVGANPNGLKKAIEDHK